MAPRRRPTPFASARSRSTRRSPTASSELAELVSDVRNAQDVVDLRAAPLRQVVPGLEGRAAARRRRRAGRPGRPDDDADQGEARREARRFDLREHRVAARASPRTRACALPRPPCSADRHHQLGRRVQLQLLDRAGPQRPRRDAGEAARAAGRARARRVGTGSRWSWTSFRRSSTSTSRLPRLLRSVFQQQPEVAHVYLGSHRHVMERIFNDENEPFWRSAKPIELRRIDPGDLRRVRSGPIPGDRKAARCRSWRQRCCDEPAAIPTRPRSSATSCGRRPSPEATSRRRSSGAPSRRCCAPSTPTSRCSGTTPRRRRSCCWERSQPSSPAGPSRSTIAAIIDCRRPPTCSAPPGRWSSARSSPRTAASTRSPSRSWPSGSGPTSAAPGPIRLSRRPAATV